jgi:Cu-Zn family superoxide dismutase
MKKIIFGLVAVLLIIGAGALFKSVPTPDQIKTVTMINNAGESIGTIELSSTNAGVLLNLDLNGLTPDGEHAMHIHEVGDCTPLESFKNSGGHFNPHGKHHGMKHPEGQHAGDMPNLKPDGKGAIATTILNRHVTLDSGQAGVFDADGSALIIHAGADDHMSQPSGAAGARIACGVIGE